MQTPLRCFNHKLQVMLQNDAATITVLESEHFMKESVRKTLQASHLATKQLQKTTRRRLGRRPASKKTPEMTDLCSPVSEETN